MPIQTLNKHLKFSYKNDKKNFHNKVTRFYFLTLENVMIVNHQFKQTFQMNKRHKDM